MPNCLPQWSGHFAFPPVCGGVQPTFHMLNGHTWLVATVLNSITQTPIITESSIENAALFKAYLHNRKRANVTASYFLLCIKSSSSPTGF